MPRKSKAIEGITKNKNGTYRWRTTVGFRKGKQIRLGGTTLTLKQAKLDKAKAETDYARRVLAVPEQIVLSDYSRRWLEEQEIEPNTRKMYRSDLNYSLELIGDMLLHDIRPIHIKEMSMQLKNRVMRPRTKAKNELPRTMSTRTLNAVRARLSAVMATAVVEQYIYVNPVAATKRIKGSDYGNSRRGVALDFDEATRLRKLGEGLYEAGVCRLWGAIFTAISIGLRRGEVMGLRWQDINFEKNILYVRQNLLQIDGVVSIGKPKTRQSVRDIPIPKSLQVILQRQFEAMKAEALMRGET